jgi:hypothetical protein
MDDYNIDNTPLINPREALAYLFNTSYTHIAWIIRSGPEYPNNLNIVGTF